MIGAWYVVGTRPRAEKRAEMSLREDGLDSFMPFVTRWAVSGRRRYKAQHPLFVGYVFVFVPGGDGERNFHKVRGCDGVERVLGTHGPLPVQTKKVHELRQAQLLGAFDETLEAPPGPFTAGQPIKVRVGNKFADWPGTVLGMTPAGRVKVLLSMFGKDHEKELAADELQAA